MLAFFSCLWQAQGVYLKASGAVTQMSPWQPQHHCCSSGTQVGAYVDLSLKEQRCWSGRRITKKNIELGRGTKAKVEPESPADGWAGTERSQSLILCHSTALRYCELVQMTSFFLDWLFPHSVVWIERIR